MGNNTGPGCGCLALLLAPIALFGVWYVPDWGWIKNEVTVYSAQCAEKVVANQCGTHLYTVRPTTYKLLPEQQTVIYWIEGFGAQKVTKCAIASVENWTCQFDDESAEFGFQGGEYFHRSLGAESAAFKELREEEYYLPRWRYLLLTWQGK